MLPCNGNYSQENIGWMINFIKEFRESQENDFKIALQDYMQKYFNSVFSEIMYVPETESIRLQMASEAQGDGVHSYKDSALIIM